MSGTDAPCRTASVCFISVRETSDLAPEFSVQESLKIEICLVNKCASSDDIEAIVGIPFLVWILPIDFQICDYRKFYACDLLELCT